MQILWFTLALVAVFTVWAGLRALLVEIRRFHGPLAYLSQPTPTGVDEEWTRRVRELEDLVDVLPSKWEQYREQARAAEERTRGRIRRAVESIEEGDPDGYVRLQAVADEAGFGDGDGSDAGGVPPMRPPVESPPEPPQGSEDWIGEVNRLKFAN